MWFSTDKEIITKKKKRNDFLPHELYITPSWDVNPLTAINGKATVLSFDMFQRRNNANFEQKVQGEEDIAVHPSGNTSDELDDFIFVEINGMKITDPHQSYSLLWEALKSERPVGPHKNHLSGV
ncbi:hypothetical protein HYQ45_000299 [Verticillium longisporum]|uniref:Uncharacterized protein n=1 Tax=Verticillium longisporum TaxID=100787 RepID=A0A8I3AXP0_VERLO|nr:hypothetical protein HYQ45_000299 [Verticillium longisporum]